MTLFDPSKIVFPPHVAYRETDTLLDLVLKGLVPENPDSFSIGEASNLSNYYAYEYLARMCQQTYGVPLVVQPRPRQVTVDSFASGRAEGGVTLDTSEFGLDLLAHGIGKPCGAYTPKWLFIALTVVNPWNLSRVWSSRLVHHVHTRVVARHPLYRSAVFSHAPYAGRSKPWDFSM